MKRTMLAFGLAAFAFLAMPLFSSVAYAQNHQMRGQQTDHRQFQPNGQFHQGGQFQGGGQVQDHRQPIQQERREVRPPQVQPRVQPNWQNQPGRVNQERQHDPRIDNRRDNDRRDWDRRDNGRRDWDRRDNDRDHRNPGWNGGGVRRDPDWRREDHRGDNFRYHAPPPFRYNPIPRPDRYNYGYRDNYRGHWSARGGFQFYGGFYFGGSFFRGAFFAGPDYCPTEWIFELRAGRWFRPGFGYVYRAPAYYGPITVAVDEQVFAGYDYYGTPVYETVTMYYNATYYPSVGRYGYVDIDGDFNWLNW